MRLFLIGLVFTIGLCGNGFSRAEAQPAERFGRQADGRAFRVDAQGMVLVDQMAELEVTVDELRRQVIALENELVSKNRQIKQLKAGHATAANVDEVREENLLQPVSSGAAPDCSAQVRPLQAQMLNLQNQLNDSRNQVEQARRELTERPNVKSCDYESRENPLWVQVERLQEELMKGPSREELARTGQEHESLRRKLSEYEAELSARAEMIAELKQELSNEQGRVEELNQALALSAETTRAERDSVAAVKETAEVMRTPESPAARKLQQRLALELEAIDALIRQRKLLLDRAKESGRAHQAQPLMTSNGLTLDRLRSEVANLNWRSNSATVQDGLQEIANLLRKDISALNGL